MIGKDELDQLKRYGVDPGNVDEDGLHEFS